jgi:excisionase family DNA binding protein
VPTPVAPPVERLVYTIQEAAAVLRISRTKLYDLMAAGEVESIHIGRSRRIPADVLRSYVSGLCTRAAADDKADQASPNSPDVAAASVSEAVGADRWGAAS